MPARRQPPKRPTRAERRLAEVTAVRSRQLVVADSQRSSADLPTYGIPLLEIARRCQVERTTAWRWKRGRAAIPYAARCLLTGDLGAFSAGWKGWRISGEEIISPDGWTIRRQDALVVPLMHGQISALQEQVAGLQAELAEALEWMTKQDQPLPPDELPVIRS